MLVIVGSIVVIISTLGGFIIAGGKPILLVHVSEFVVIGGVALGVMITASPGHVLKHIISDTIENIKGGGAHAVDYLELMKLLYEVFNLARKNGLIAVDEHISDPASSSIFSKYLTFLNDKARVEFLINALRPIIDGKIKPEQLEGILNSEIRAKEQEANHVIHMLHLVGDSLPGIGIVAAVLGIINTMSAIAEGPEAVGEKVAAALTGTFLGIFGAYGFIHPLAQRIEFTNQTKFLYMKIVASAVSSFSKGLAPLMAIEVSRRMLDSSVQPAADELEVMLKELNKA